MNRLWHFLASPLTHFACGAALSLVWLLFAAAHVARFMQTGNPSLLLFCIAETVIAGLLLVRSQPKSFTHRPEEWVVAILGTLLPLLFRPTPGVLVPGADWGVTIGAAIQISGALSLNRSFAIVPALRELKTRGMYGLVRHPIYASYLVTFVSYLAAYFSMRNLLVFIASVLLLFARVHSEERHLSTDADYRAYRRRVKWRLIPFVF